MAQADAQVIMPRRGFLTRALGFTTAGATLALPIITVADARARAEHHVKGLITALQDVYPGTKIMGGYHFPEGLEADPRVLIDRFLVTIRAEVPASFPGSARRIDGWREYDRWKAAGRPDYHQWVAAGRPEA
jgi:hypothetical protein